MIDRLLKHFLKFKTLRVNEEADALNKKLAKMSAFLKSPERVAKIVEEFNDA